MILPSGLGKVRVWMAGMVGLSWLDWERREMARAAEV